MMSQGKKEKKKKNVYLKNRYFKKICAKYYTNYGILFI